MKYLVILMLIFASCTSVKKLKHKKQTLPCTKVIVVDKYFTPVPDKEVYECKCLNKPIDIVIEERSNRLNIGDTSKIILWNKYIKFAYL